MRPLIPDRKKSPRRTGGQRRAKETVGPIADLRLAGRITVGRCARARPVEGSGRPRCLVGILAPGRCVRKGYTQAGTRKTIAVRGAGRYARLREPLLCASRLVKLEMAVR